MGRSLVVRNFFCYPEPGFAYTYLLDRHLAVCDPRSFRYRACRRPSIGRLVAALSAVRYRRFYSARKNRFPAGLLPYALQVLDRAGVVPTVIDRRPDPPRAYPPKIYGAEPRPYQLAAAQAILQRRVAGIPWPRGLIQLPAASGKTLVLALLASAYREDRVLVLTHRRDLLYQTAEDLGRYLGEPVGMVGAGKCTLHRVTVGMLQTLRKNQELLLGELAGVKVLLADEAHHLSATTFSKVAALCPSYVRVGVSAMPTRESLPVERMRLWSVLSDTAYMRPASELIADGYIAPVLVVYKTIGTPEGCYDTPYSHDGYDRLIVHNAGRNARIAGFARTRTKPTLIVVNRLTHGEVLSRALGCQFVSGEESMEVRRRALRDLGQGRVRWLVASPIFDEGVDAPAIRNLVLAGAGKSELQLMQRIGRGMRKRSPDDRLTVLDFLDRFNRYFYGQSLARLRQVEAAGFATKMLDGR